jgi:hypothetical protein
MLKQWVKMPMAARVFVALLVGVSLGCAERPDPPAQSPRASDYDVYAVVLREHFLNPPQDDHADGIGRTCASYEPVGYIPIVAQTRLRQEGGRSRDSSLAAALPPEVAPLVVTLRAMDGQPPQTLSADSFSLGVPVRLVAGSPEPGSTTDGPWPITLSRVAYNADSTWALVHAVQPCREEHDETIDEEDLEGASPPGTAVVAALQRRSGSWAVAEVVYVYVE